MSTCCTTLPTVGVIARATGKSIHAVEYVIRTRDIKPIGRAGNARVFSLAAVQRIKGELARIDDERGGNS